MHHVYELVSGRDATGAQLPRPKSSRCTNHAFELDLGKGLGESYDLYCLGWMVDAMRP